MYSVYDYGRMVAGDKVRTDAYLAALKSVVTPDSVVVDLGAGIGLFALAAAKMGARRVFAIENNESAEIGREIAHAAGLADRVTFIQRSAWDLDLPEPATILFYDLRGTLPFYADNFALVRHAKTRWLAPGGVHFPARDRLRAAIVTAPKLYEKLTRAFTAAAYFGLPVDPAKRCIVNARTNDRDDPIRTSDVLTESFEWASLEYGDTPPRGVSGQGDIAALRAGRAHGIAVWFETDLISKIGYNTAPGREPTYSRAFLPLETPIDIEAGDRIAVALSALTDGSEWGWSIVITGRDGTMVRGARQSTLLAESRPIEAIMLDAPSARPALSEDGARVAKILAAFDGKKTITELAHDFARSSAEEDLTRTTAEIRALVRAHGR